MITKKEFVEFIKKMCPGNKLNVVDCGGLDLAIFNSATRVVNVVKKQIPFELSTEDFEEWQPVPKELLVPGTIVNVSVSGKVININNRRDDFMNAMILDVCTTYCGGVRVKYIREDGLKGFYPIVVGCTYIRYKKGLTFNFKGDE